VREVKPKADGHKQKFHFKILGRLRKFGKALLARHSIEDLSPAERRAMWPMAKQLSDRHLRNCRILENRTSMLDLMPKQATCAEVGIFHGDFSQQILMRTQPAEFHLIDIKQAFVEAAKKRFADSPCRFHCGESSLILQSLPNAYFDWIYIDADHSYEAVRRDLEAARTKLKSTGLIALNDYIFFAPSCFQKFGVVEAVNEFCVAHDFEWVFFALQGRLYNDVVIRRID
jgi:hypothetical protein